jgi:hypothetical protein
MRGEMKKRKSLQEFIDTALCIKPKSKTEGNMMEISKFKGRNIIR